MTLRDAPCVRLVHRSTHHGRFCLQLRFLRPVVPQHLHTPLDHTHVLNGKGTIVGEAASCLSHQKIRIYNPSSSLSNSANRNSANRGRFYNCTTVASSRVCIAHSLPGTILLEATRRHPLVLYAYSQTNAVWRIENRIPDLNLSRVKIRNDACYGA